MQFRLLIEKLSCSLFKRDVDALLETALKLNESGKLSNKDWEAFGKIAINYRSFMLD